MNDNKLIAEFMGLESFKDSLASLHQGKINVDVDVYEQAQYHTSWDWLMPVVLKCKESVDYCSDDNALEYHNIEDEMLSQLSIKDTYKAVVEFIKTYNNESRNI